jgi:putative transposase
MSNPQNDHHRQSIRLKGYDYSLAGAYFVTLTACQHNNLFGTITDSTVQLNLLGQCAAAIWQDIPHHFDVTLAEWVVMPDHLHGVLVLPDHREGNRIQQTNRDGKNQAGQPGSSPYYHLQQKEITGTAPGSLSAIIQNYKSVSTRRINSLRCSRGEPVWQKNYYEHIIRSEEDWVRIAVYINGNPDAWE